MPDYLKFTDVDLIARCLEKDGEAWEALVKRYQRLIASITIKFHLSREDSTDVAQSVFLTLLQQLPNLRMQSSLSSWLITVTVRECWKLRKRGAQTDFLNDEEWEIAANSADESHKLIEQQLVIIERQHLLRHAVESLPAECRQIIKHLFYDDPQASYTEISRRLNIPIASIGPKRGRCLEKLKEILKKTGFN
jgi:RNA polymerase sigma factor (sigma-70 family)